uniref:Uncharacterized protein n=1 Tax=Toxoplasma gondii COUG TaxID=1074873 RepID=A0A2G8YA80_TOXGO|nr:hypothetical protein TGCOUG_391770 [Toxoplasma gondii COUG]
MSVRVHGNGTSTARGEDCSLLPTTVRGQLSIYLIAHESQGESFPLYLVSTRNGYRRPLLLFVFRHWIGFMAAELQCPCWGKTSSRGFPAAPIIRVTAPEKHRQSIC